MSEDIELSADEQAMMKKINGMKELGLSDDEIAAALGLNETEYVADDDIDYDDLSIELPPMHFDFGDYDENAVFKEKPQKPSFFKGAEKLKQFKPLFSLDSQREYTLNGVTRKVNKLNLRDVMRLGKKIPSWASYLGYNTPKMLVDEMTGRYRWAETILALFERAFGDYDEELDRPTDFSLSVLEEIVKLLNLKEPEPIDYILSCDPEEVYDAVAILISYNQGFFLKAYNASGPIKSLISSIFGKISEVTSKLKPKKNSENTETSLTNSETSD